MKAWLCWLGSVDVGGWRVCRLAVRLVLSLWLVLVGVVFGIAALGYTSPPSRQWWYMAMALLCVKVGLTIADERRLPL